MTKWTRRKINAALKAKIGLEAVREQATGVVWREGPISAALWTLWSTPADEISREVIDGKVDYLNFHLRKPVHVVPFRGCISSTVRTTGHRPRDRGTIGRSGIYGDYRMPTYDNT